MLKIKPRYFQIAETLEEEIQELAPNSLLATEDQMAERFKVSRITVRAALDLLENSGKISRLRGRGTIVSPRKLVRNLSPYMSFEADMKSQGINFSNKLLSFETGLTPSAHIVSRLGLNERDKVARLTLSRQVNQQTICHEERFYPNSIGNKIKPEEVEKSDCSLILEKATKRKIETVSWHSEIMSSSREVANSLGIASRSLVFNCSYTWFDNEHQSIETGLISYRIDRCQFHFEDKFKNR
tara:strand:- start:3369 stop:4091 length:723 start_codon:yes stop_codon:yes gene_type:complete